MACAEETAGAETAGIGADGTGAGLGGSGGSAIAMRKDLLRTKGRKAGH
mgnify:CR=1 FL=1